MRRLLLREILFLVILTNLGGISFHLEKEDGCKHEDGDYCHPDCHLDHGGDDDYDDGDDDDDYCDGDYDGDDLYIMVKCLSVCQVFSCFFGTK